MAINPRRYRSIHNQACKLLFKSRDGSSESSGHRIEIHRDEGAEVLDEGLVADARVEGLDVVVQVDVEFEVGLDQRC